MALGGARSGLSVSAIAVVVGCSMIYETSSLTEGGDSASGASGGVPSAGGGGLGAAGSSSGTSGGDTGGTTSTTGGAPDSGGGAGAPADDLGGAAGAGGAGGTPPDCSGTYYPDEDGDGWGNDNEPGVDCEMPGYAPPGDCADADPFNNPGLPEYCDGVENDCNAGTPDDCPSDCQALTYDNHIYLFCWLERTFEDARAQCAANGMRLVRLDNSDEQSWVTTWHITPTAYDSWTGGSDVAAEGTWVWEDGETFWDNQVPILYYDWAGGEPSNSSQMEHCLMLNAGDWWNDHNCAEALEYTCERY